MIQRAQSIYLLMVTVLMSFLLLWPYASLSPDANEVLSFRSHAIVSLSSDTVTGILKPTLPLLMLVLITGIISLVNIFMYHHRIKQIRICLLNTGLLVVLMLLMVYYYYSTMHSVDPTQHAFRLPAILPVLSIILTLVAARAIHRDEMLVKSYERIR